MLSDKGLSTTVEKIVMADWDINGYKDLRFSTDV
jgi:hypothetical protein